MNTEVVLVLFEVELQVGVRVALREDDTLILVLVEDVRVRSRVTDGETVRLLV